jgi:hypothetical protein
VARAGERGGSYRVLVGKPERKNPLGRSKNRCEVRRVFKSMDGRACSGSISGEGKVSGSCDHGDEPSGSIEYL